MNKILLVLSALALLAAPGCKKARELINFQITDSQSFTVPSGLPVPPGVLVPLPSRTVPSTARTAYASKGTTTDLVENVNLEEMTLTITGPAGQNFNFLRRIELYISTDASGSDKVLLASLASVPAGVSTISLVPGGNKLDQYLRGDTYTILTNAEINSRPTQNIDIRADSRFSVRARLK